jgi:hypothetical protein
VNKDTIVQFVCFTSTLEPEKFIEIWEPYAKHLVSNPESMILQEGVAEKNGNRFNYVSQHRCSAADFSFAFMKEKKKMHFPEQRARIMQAGGYQQVANQSVYTKQKNDVRVMAFLTQGETDLEFYEQQNFRHLNKYEAYFENCAYSYIMEFFMADEDAQVLVQQLKARNGVEAGIYKDCKVFQTSKKLSGSLL